MTTGQRIKALRLSKGLSQEELGEAIGVKKAAINKYENGIVVNLKRSTISLLADALDTTPAYLMGWDESNSHQQEISESDMMAAFFNGTDPSMTQEEMEEMWADAKEYFQFKIAQRRNHQKND